MKNYKFVNMDLCLGTTKFQFYLDKKTRYIRKKDDSNDDRVESLNHVSVAKKSSSLTY